MGMASPIGSKVEPRSQDQLPLAYMSPHHDGDPWASVYFHLAAEGLWPWTQPWERSLPPWFSIRLLAWK